MFVAGWHAHFQGETMKRTHLAVLVAAIALGGSSLTAQQPTSAAAKKGTPQHDSLKTAKKTIKSDKTALKAANKKGDTATASALKKEIKDAKKTKAALKGDTAKKPAPKKKP
jgi:hypothetical protein